MRLRSHVLLVLVSIVGTGLLIACRSGSAPSASGPASSTAAAGSGAPAANAPLTKLTVSYPEGGAHLPLWYAKEKGIFQKNGLNVDLQGLGGGPPAMAALLSNQTQFADITGSVVTAANGAGSDVVVLATLDPVYPYVLEVPADIKSANDLKGKGIAVRAFGDATDVAARVALQKLNLVPDKDVKIQAVNSEGARVAAVEAGQICCTVAQPQDQLVLEPQGYHVLVDFSTLGLLNAQGVIAAQRSYINANKATVQAFMDSLVQAIAAEKDDKPGSVAIIKTYLKLDDKAATVLYDYFVGKVIPSNPAVSAAQFVDGTAVLATQNDKLKGFDMAKYVDTSFLQNAVAKGNKR
ncbi:MAG TPA: ABC transporter substrate-binding protein [Dehalococcoidia bacterium]|nr:ABC transporter substrate-binding protein [Dehalococcoidia bacterium]